MMNFTDKPLDVSEQQEIDTTECTANNAASPVSKQGIEARSPSDALKFAAIVNLVCGILGIIVGLLGCLIFLISIMFGPELGASNTFFGNLVWIICLVAIFALSGFSVIGGIFSLKCYKHPFSYALAGSICSAFLCTAPTVFWLSQGNVISIMLIISTISIGALIATIATKEEFYTNNDQLF